MKTVSSFTIDHERLLPGLYLSRRDTVGNDVVSTFDLRMTAPNREPVMSTGEIHAIEHLAATWLRNDPKLRDKVLYFGPMGCRTGFYLILVGDWWAPWVVRTIADCFRFISEYTGDIPGATPKGCGNYSDMDLPAARRRAEQYFNTLESATVGRMIYPR